MFACALTIGRCCGKRSREKNAEVAHASASRSGLTNPATSTVFSPYFSICTVQAIKTTISPQASRLRDAAESTPLKRGIAHGCHASPFDYRSRIKSEEADNIVDYLANR